MDFRQALQEAEPQVPELKDPLDLTPARTELAKYEKTLIPMEQEAQSIKVKDDDSAARAVAIAGGAKTLHKDLKRAQETLIAPANSYLKTVRNLFKPYLDRLEAIENGLKRSSEGYYYQQRMEQQRREAAAREEARKQQEKIDAEARRLREEAERKAREAAEALEKEADEARRAALQKTIEEETAAAQAAPPVVVAPVVEEKPRVTRTETGSGHLRMDWDFEVIDANQVPRKYLMVNEKAIRADVKAGLREIPGVKIFEKPVMNIRT
jgi:hypothetical protein